jgi:signal transduction histidine kinase
MSLRSEIVQLEELVRRACSGDKEAQRQLPARFESLRREAETLIKHQQELITLYEIARELASMVNLDDILDLILTRALALVKAERGFIVLADEPAGEEGFRIAVARQFSLEEVDDGEVRLSRSLIGRVMQTRQAVVTTNAQEDPRFQSSASIVNYRIRSVMAVPLIYERDLLGAIYLDTRITERLFTQEDLALLQALGNQAAIALHMAQLYRHLEQRNQELQQALAELRATQDELIRSERLSAVGRLASGIIHDFKTPMTTIKGYAAFLGRDDLPPAQRKQFAQTVMNAVDILVGMAQEILDFVQGGGALQMEPVPLDAFVQEVVDFLREDFRERHITIHTQLEYRGVVSLDKGKMRRVLVNIAGNARDALNGQPGTFTIISRRQDDQVVLELIDDGPGIPPEILPNLFQPFVTHGKAHGTGLGLAISKKIVEDHGGTIAVMTGLPKGAGFVITLPLP